MSNTNVNAALVLGVVKDGEILVPPKSAPSKTAAHCENASGLALYTALNQSTAAKIVDRKLQRFFKSDTYQLVTAEAGNYNPARQKLQRRYEAKRAIDRFVKVFEAE